MSSSRLRIGNRATRIGAAAAVSLLLAAAAPSSHEAPVGTPIAAGVGYAVAVRLAHQRPPSADGALLLAFEEDGMGGVPLYESRDDGRSWRLLRHVTDTTHAGDRRWQLRWQPNLVELDRAAGLLAPGTLLLSANATRSDARGRVVEEHLQVYASSDAGRSWRYVSDIVDGAGRPEDPGNGGVWEPDIRVLPDGRLVAYYSSEKHKREGYNQLLAHKVSADGGLTWGAETIDVARPGEVERPGMAVVERTPGGGYLMSYEDIDGPNNGQVFIKSSPDGLSWGAPADRGTPVRTLSGGWPAASPVVRWFDDGSPRGVLVVAAERGGGTGDPDGRTLYWNADGGRGSWWRMPAPVRKLTGNIHAGWTQALLPSADGRELINITSSSSPNAPSDPAANTLLIARAPLTFDRYEAEDALRSGAVQIDADTASSRAKLRIEVGGSARFPIKLGRTSSGAVVIRHADVDRSAPLHVTVDGRPAPAGVDAPDGDRWRRLTIAVGPLAAGSHEIVVSAPSHAVDLDFVELPERDRQLVQFAR